MLNQCLKSADIPGVSPPQSKSGWGIVAFNHLHLCLLT